MQQIYENLELDLDLKLLFMVTGAYYESGQKSVEQYVSRRSLRELGELILVCNWLFRP